MNSRFGKLISDKRMEKGLSLQKLADEMNKLYREKGQKSDDGKIKTIVTPSYINRLEKEQGHNPSFLVVCYFCKALNLNLNEVLESFNFEELVIKKDNIDCIKLQQPKTLEKLLRDWQIEIPADISEINERASGDYHYVQYIKSANSYNKTIDYLSDEEKEILIKIIFKVIEYACAGEKNKESRISDIINLLHSISEERSKVISKLYEENNTIKIEEFVVANSKYSIYLDNNAYDSIKKDESDKNTILDLIKRLDTKLNSILGEFMINNNEKGIIVTCHKYDKNIIVKKIIRTQLFYFSI